MRNIVLGVNAYHGDASACLVINGKLVAAVEEERFNRVKHWAGFPSQSIRYCLDEANLKLEDIDYLAINTDPKANFSKKILYTLINLPSPSMILDRISNRSKRLSLEEELESKFPGQKFKGELKKVDHHQCHLVSAHFVSPFEDSVVVSVDGFGDFSSGSFGVARGSEITVDENIYFPHSLGIFYQSFTQYLGFPNYGDEYKVMGLAPYGKPKYVDQLMEVVNLKDDGLYELNLKYFRHHNENIDMEWEGGSPSVGHLFKEKNVHDLLNLPLRTKNIKLADEHFDLAHSVQIVYERAFFHILNEAYERHGLKEVTVAGGCGNNSVANGKIYRNTPFERSYIAAASGDAGGAIGAAFQVVIEENLNQDDDRFHMSHAYWGPSFSEDHIQKLIRERKEELEKEGCTIETFDNETELCSSVALEISKGLVIGWFQDRMEWGPRALGNRSILCDPRRADMKDILNLKIKRRESFRPFAPSILMSHVADWFEEVDEVPFMMQVFQFKEEKRSLVPAVVHVDGSGRLQTVSEHTNKRYNELISQFNKLTDVPILLNTSFNENEPIVCKPEEALDCFMRTKMDLVVLGNTVIRR